MDNDQTIHTIKTLTSNNSNQSRKPTCNLCSKLSAKSNHNLCCNRSKWPRWSASLIFVSYFQFRTNQRKANVLSNQSQRMPHFCLDCLQLPQANSLLKGTPSRLQPFLFSHSSDCLWVSAKSLSHDSWFPRYSKLWINSLFFISTVFLGVPWRYGRPCQLLSVCSQPGMKFRCS